MFAVTETSGFWATAVRTGAFSRIVATQDVPMVLSCVSAGNCTAGFSADDAGGNTQAFVVSQAGGAWGTAIQVPGTASLNIGTGRVTSVSCTAAGNCSAVGNYQAVLEVNQPFVINQRNGTWGTAQPVSIGAIGGTAAQMNAVSCGASGSEAESVARPSSGNCAAACSSAGNCVLGGDYQDSRFFEQAFLVNETGRIWRTAQAVPGITAINTSIAQTQAVSCGPGGPCTAAGIYSGQGASFHAWVIAQAAA
jgi:hypothetical protein